jgi:hypothetical protein
VVVRVYDSGNVVVHGVHPDQPVLQPGPGCLENVVVFRRPFRHGSSCGRISSVARALLTHLRFDPDRLAAVHGTVLCSSCRRSRRARASAYYSPKTCQSKHELSQRRLCLPVTARWSVAAAASFASRRGAVFTTFALALALTWGSTSRPSGSAASSARVIPLTVASTTVGRVGRTADWFAVRTGHIRRFVTLLADDDAELHDFTVANRTDGFLRVVLDDGRLKQKKALTTCTQNNKKYLIQEFSKII